MSAGDWKEMYFAASDGNMELLQYHIKNGVNPNYQHPEVLSTPLVASIIAGHIFITKFLLDHGADPKLLSEFDNLTPVEAARLYKRKDVLLLLGEAANEGTWIQKTLRRISGNA